MIVAVLGFALLDGAGDSQAYSGTGTESDPLILNSAADLAMLAAGTEPDGEDKYFRLGNDIALSTSSSYYWTPIGSGDAPFRGHLDGAGHAITNLKISMDAPYLGFFGAIEGAEIKDLRITVNGGIQTLCNVNYGERYVGVLAGKAVDSDVSYVRVTSASGGVRVMPNVVDLSDEIYMGGLVGAASETSITGCGASITISLSANIDGLRYSSEVHAGGLIGSGDSSTVSLCYATGRIECTVRASADVGGFIGTAANCSIDRSYYRGDYVLARGGAAGDRCAVGGFVGASSDSSISLCYAITTLAQNYGVRWDPTSATYDCSAGGFAGIASGTISNCYAASPVNVASTGAGSKSSYFSNGSATVTGSFYGSQYYRAGPSPTNNGSGLTDIQLQTPVSFGDWQQSGEWIWDSRINGGMPAIRDMYVVISVPIDPPSSGSVYYGLNAPASTLCEGTIYAFHGDKVYLRASPNSDTVFLMWSGDDVDAPFSMQATIDLPPEADGVPTTKTAEAHFGDKDSSPQLTLGAIPSAGGSFTYEVDGVPGTHSYTAAKSFPAGTRITVTAVPAAGWSFSFWATDSPWKASPVTAELTLDGSLTLSAVFVQPTSPNLKITADPAGAGSFTFDIGTSQTAWVAAGIPYDPADPLIGMAIPANQYVRVHAAAIGDHIFTGWRDGTYDSVVQGAAIARMTSSREMVAEFVDGVTVSAAAYPEGSGSFRFSTDGLNFLPASSVTVIPGIRVYVQAYSEPGYTFSMWLGDGTSSQTDLIADADKIVTAYFSKTADSHTVTVSSTSGGSVAVAINGLPAIAPISLGSERTIRVTSGDDVTITAIEGTGLYSMMLGTQNVFDPVNTISILDIDRDWVETAYFTTTQNTYQLTAGSSGGGHVEVSVEGWGAPVSAPGMGSMTMRVDRTVPVSITAMDDAGYFQNFKTDNGALTAYSHLRTLPIAAGTVSTSTYSALATFTSGSDVYSLNLYSSTTGYITYKLGDAPVIELSGAHAILVDKGVEAEIGYREIPGAGYFMYFAIDGAESLPGPKWVASDDQDHSVSALFTASISDIYTLVVTVHGTGTVLMRASEYPPERVTSSVSVRLNASYSFSLTCDPSDEPRFQYSKIAQTGKPVQYDLIGDGFSMLAQDISAGDTITVDVYFAVSSDRSVSISVEGAGFITFSLNGSADVVPYGAQIAHAIPMGPADSILIGHTGNNFQYYVHSTGGSSKVDLSGDIHLSSITEDHAVVACFTATSSPRAISLSTQGMGYVTFQVRGHPAGEYRSPSASASFDLLLDADDSVELGFREFGGRFQYLMLDSSPVFRPAYGSSLGSVTGAASHAATAYFTSTEDTYSIWVTSAGSGYVEVVDQRSNVMQFYAQEREVEIPCDAGLEIKVNGYEINGYFRYFQVEDIPDAGLGMYAIEGDRSGAPHIDGFSVQSSKRIRAFFTDDKTNIYTLILNVDEPGKGALRYQTGSSPWITDFRGLEERTIYVDVYSQSHFGYDDSGASDGYFQYYLVDDGSGQVAAFDPPNLTGSPASAAGKTYRVTASFTQTKDPGLTYYAELSVSGNGYVTFKAGSDAAGEYGGVVPRRLYVDSTDPLLVGMRTAESVPFLGFGYDSDTLNLLASQTSISISDATDHSVIAFFDADFRLYSLHVRVYGGGSASVKNGADPEAPIGAGSVPAAEYTVQAKAFRDVTVMASQTTGLFQGMFFGGARAPGTSLTIPSGTVPEGGDAYVDVYFTKNSSDVYTLRAMAYPGGYLTYDIGGRGAVSVGYTSTDIPVDIGDSVQIGNVPAEGVFQFFMDNDRLVTAPSFEISEAVPGARHDVYARFTVSSSVYYVDLGVIGDGSLRLQFMGTEIFVSQPPGSFSLPLGEDYDLSVDFSQTGSGRFQYFEYTPAGASQAEAVLNPFTINGSAGETHSATARFTSGQYYLLKLSTIGSADGGRIGYDTGGLTAWYQGSNVRDFPIDVSDAVTISADASMFQFYVRDNFLVMGQATISIPSGNTADTAVAAYFSNPSSSYAVSLSTIGEGSVEYQVGLYNASEYRSSGDPRSKLSLSLDVATSLRLNAKEGDGKFVHYIYNGTVRREAELLVSTSASPVPAGYAVDATARFTGADYYALSLNTTIGGEMTYSIDGNPEGRVSGLVPVTVYVDASSDAVLGNQPAPGSKFVWFHLTDRGEARMADSSGTIALARESVSVQGVFTTAETIDVRLKTVGSGNITLTLGSYGTLRYASPSASASLQVPASMTWNASLGYENRDGHFQYFELSRGGTPSEVVLAPFSITSPQAGTLYDVTARFTKGAGDYSIDLSKRGEGSVTFRIGGGATVSLSNPVSNPYRLYVDSSDSVQVGHSAGVFQYFETSGSRYSGPQAAPSLTFAANTTGAHSVTAVFAETAGAHLVSLGTTGDGYITFWLDTMGDGEYARFKSVSSSRYEMYVDNEDVVRIGEEEMPGAHFIGFTEGSAPSGLLLTASLEIAVRSPHEVTAHFTNAGQTTYAITLSTIGNGGITASPSSIPGKTATFRSSDSVPSYTLYAPTGSTVAIGHTSEPGERFNAFIADGAPEYVDSRTYSSGNHSIAAWFASGLDAYEVSLSTRGAGKIAYSVGGVSGEYSGSGWDLYAAEGDAVSLEAVSAGGMFQYFAYMGPGDLQPVARLQSGMTVNGVAGGMYSATACFTADGTNVYAVEMSTVGSGYITFGLLPASHENPVGEFRSLFHATTYTLYVDDGVSLSIGYREDAGRFQFFDLDGEAAVPPAYDPKLTIVGGDHSVVARFTDTLTTYVLNLSSEGRGSITFSTDGSNTYATKGISFPVDGGEAVAIGEAEEPDGRFQFFVRDGIVDPARPSLSISVSYPDGAHSVQAVFTSGDSFGMMTVGHTGSGHVELTVDRYGSFAFDGGLFLDAGSRVGVRAVPADGSDFVEWTGDAAGEEQSFTHEVAASSEYTAIAAFESDEPYVPGPEGPGGPDDPYQPPAPVTYTITASSDTGSSIDPSGTVSVASGGSRTFSFSARDGMEVADVIVDGSSVGVPAGMAYTFSNVRSNHSIAVVSAPVTPFLMLRIEGGEGKLEYSIGMTAQFLDYSAYSGMVPVEAGDFVSVRVTPDDGYRFTGWTGTQISGSAMFSFVMPQGGADLTAVLAAEGSQASDGGIASWAVIIAAALLLLLLFLLLLFLLRRRYDVIKVESELTEIIGRDKAYRKSDYCFSVEGEPEKPVRYRVDDGRDEEEIEWRAPEVRDGGYVIPGREVVGDITIEAL
ncbi:MAG: hypothetical protein LBG62_00905 [Candidatus Methanoplasma sp.]|nr:hypothetical protein [Candidatus Methanoplasma sp.]